MDRNPTGSFRRLSLANALAMGVVAALAARAAAGGLAPASLWLDDLWVAVLAEKASFAQIFELKAPVSPLFVLLLRLFLLGMPDGDLSFQILPFLCMILNVFVIAAAGYRLTGRRLWGLACAALLAVNPVMLTYSVRVKSYTLDALAISVLLLVALIRPAREDERDLVPWLAAILAPISFTTVFLSVPLVVARQLDRLKRRNLIGVAIFVVAVASTYLLLMEPRSTPDLKAFWDGFYFPMTPSLIIPFVRTRLLGFLTNPLPSGFGFLVILAIPGIWWTWRKQRTIALAIIGMIGLILVASSMRAYPIGTGRTEAFAFPAMILLVVAGLHMLLERRERVESAVALSCALICCALLLKTNGSYADANDRQVVELAKTSVRAGDGLVIYPLSTWAVAHYGPWEVELVPEEVLGYIAIPVRENTVIIRPARYTDEVDSFPQAVGKQMRPWLNAAPDDVWFLGTSVNPAPNQAIVDAFLGNGYRVVKATRLRGAGFALFHRSEFPSEPKDPEAADG